MDHSPFSSWSRTSPATYTFVNRLPRLGRRQRQARGRQDRPRHHVEGGADEVALADAKVIATKAPLQREMTIETPTGRRTMLSVKFPLLDATNSVSAIGTIVTDITDRKHAEAQLSQAQRMDAVGQLTGGVAHDFSNMLTTILLNADVLATEIENDRLRQLAEGCGAPPSTAPNSPSRLLAGDGKR